LDYCAAQDDASLALKFPAPRRRMKQPPDSSARRKSPFRIFTPILPGASLRDRALACCGAVAGIGLTGVLCSLAFGKNPHLPLLVAPMGASAVLLFAVPASPLAQPWPIIGGNVISAIVGIIVGQFISDPMIASGVAVALAIAAMSLTRCLHPPGGAAALSAVLAGPAIAANGYMYPLVPVGVNAIVLVALGWLFHSFTRRPWPHVAAPVATNPHKTFDPPPAQRVGFKAEDVDAALVDLGEAFDIDRDDLDRLLRRVELRALSRRSADPVCADIMSRDLITVKPGARLEKARALLLDHGVRTLPVMDGGRLEGVVGLRETALDSDLVRDVMRPAATATPATPVIDLLGKLTDGLTHAVVIVGEHGHVHGLVTQTDLLTALAQPSEGALA
jgi:CBS domain-containing membrane protein